MQNSFSVNILVSDYTVVVNYINATLKPLIKKQLSVPLGADSSQHDIDFKLYGPNERMYELTLKLHLDVRYFGCKTGNIQAGNLFLLCSQLLCEPMGLYVNTVALVLTVPTSMNKKTSWDELFSPSIVLCMYLLFSLI